MRSFIILVSVVLGSLLLSACQNTADLKRQKNLEEQTNRTYAVTEKKATEEQPKNYEFCGNEQYPCSDVTQTHFDQEEK
ncbi:MAG: hypothetical protein LRY67_07235 [Gammaproteobacteria bacterium]|nr:hypothetical protein [Gammaproteobacteria bacterium]MCD8525491.1 hypothetical protein [Gammaproteobacteria bacterium]